MLIKSRVRSNNQQSVSDRKICVDIATKRRLVLNGFPVQPRNLSKEDIDNYFSYDDVTCLLCGKLYKSLSEHIQKIHSIRCDEYREMYGIAYGQPLCCKRLSEKKSKDTKKRIENGYDPKINLENHREKAYSTKKRQSAAAINAKRKNIHDLVKSNGHSSLAWEQVEEIRARYGDGENIASIADMFGVTYPTVHSIVNNNTWKNYS